MAEVIVKTRITPRKLTEKIVSRQRLLNLMETGLSKNMILITAPAGYGKTTLVLDFLSRLNKLFTWFYIAPDTGSFYSFMNYLVHSVRSINPDFGNRTIELLESLSESGSIAKDEKGSIAAISGTFVNEFVSSFSEDVYIVIDDLQNAGNSSWLNNTFNSLIEDFPPNLHILITSRNIPEFNISRLGAKRNLLKIDAADLNFSYAETAQLISEIYSIQCEDKEIAVFENKIEGWITGMHLVLQAYGNNFPAAVKGKIDDSLYDYFANEIFINLESDLQDFLLATSLTDSFSDELCRILFDNNNTGQLIDSLKHKNIFVEITAGESSIMEYSYHNLFKQFLIKKLYEVRSPDEIKNLAGKIFSYYKKKQDNIRAIDFSLQSGTYADAVKMINDEFDELFRSGRYDILDKWLSSLPDEIKKNDNRVRFNIATLLYHYKSDNDAALEILDDLINQKDSDTYVNSCIEYSDILLLKGRAADAVKLLEGMLKTEKDAVKHTKISLELAKTYYSTGAEHYDKIISLLNDTLKLNDENNLLEFHSEIYSRYGRVYQSRGIFTKALHYFKNVVELEKNVYKKFQTLTDIVLLHSWMGEYQKAKEFLDKVNDIYKRFPISTFRKEALRITALFKFEAGDYEDAIAKFSELCSLDISMNIKSFLFLYNLFIAESYILLGSNSKAGEFIEMASDSKQADDYFHKIMIDYHKAIIENTGMPNAKAEKILLETHKFFELLNLIYPKVQVEFHLADYYFKTGNEKTSVKYLEDSVNTAANNSFSSFLSQHFISKRYLFDFAAAGGIKKDYIADIHSGLLERESYSWLSAECRKRTSKELLLLSDITVNCFGGTEIYLRGVPVTDDKWIRKKSKLLLIYLLINRGLKHTKDKILELFFAELSSASADNVFHQAVTNIRNALNPAGQTEEKTTDKKKPKDKQLPGSISYITYDDKILQVTPGYIYKIDAVEFSKLHGKIKSIQTPGDEKTILAKKAIDMYRGEFLPGYYDHWIEEQRSALQHKFIEICEVLISLLEQNNQFDEIIYYAEKLINADKLHEGAYLSMINACSKTGNENMARKNFRRLLKNYEEEYGEKPSKETLSQIESILLKYI